MPTHVIAYRSIIDSTCSCVFVGARSGSFFSNNNSIAEKTEQSLGKGRLGV